MRYLESGNSKNTPKQRIKNRRGILNKTLRYYK